MSELSQVALTPPMGWNSFDCFGSAVVEYEVLKNADYMARNLAQCGWKYVVVDFCWSHPAPAASSNPDLRPDDAGRLQPMLEMDDFGRLLPAPNRFPSAAGGQGFKPLADYVHGLGLKFGIHIMRGIPCQAVERNLPVLGANVGAAEIADLNSQCGWLNHMYGVDMAKPGAQAYYDSIFQLYAQWEVDYVKVDDIASPYHAEEIEAVRTAIDRCGRPMVLSLSPGETPIEQAAHVGTHANLWRMSADFWDDWRHLRHSFDLCAKWAPYIRPGSWPDADMLPLGRIALRGPMGEPRWTNFTRDEQITLITLFSIFRSPFMFGGHMPDNDDFTLSLMTNKELITLNQHSGNNQQLFRRGDHVAWVADRPGVSGRYLAVFNLSDDQLVEIPVTLAELGLNGPCTVRDLWTNDNAGTCEERITAAVPPHGAKAFWVAPVQS